MTAILVSFIAKFWPPILGVLIAAGGVLAAWVKSKAADTTKAQAAQSVAEAQKQVAQSDASNAQANAEAQKAGSAAAAARTDIDNQITAQPTDEVRNELAQNWTRK